MKKILAIVLVLLASMVVVANAEMDVSGMTDEELYSLRLQINKELASRIEITEVPDGATIAELFPDPILARKIRDSIGAISTKDHVTQEQLDTIKYITINGNWAGETEDFSDLSGIEYLPNLVGITIVRQKLFTVIPDSIGKCTHLKSLDLRYCGLTKLPDTICNLIALEEIDVSYNELTELPKDIGNLSNLKELDISFTKITELPESIYNLHLEKFERTGLDLD
jgi:Leucine-rich repeat (LRR) protein